MSSSLSGRPGQPSAPSPGRSRGKALLPALVVLAVLLMLFGAFTNLYTDWLWFRSVNYSSVIRTELLTKVLLFVTFGLLLGLAVALNTVLAYRWRPVYATVSPEQQTLERYRSSLAPYLRWVILAGAVALGLLGGSSAAGQWRTFLLWWHSSPFGRTDAQFNVDISFYTFSLPWWRFVLSFVFTVLILSLLASAAAHYLYGGLRLQGAGERTTPAARAHLSVLLGLFLLTKAVAYWLDRYLLAVQFHPQGIGNNDFTGLTYTDEKAVLGAKWALAGIAVICALLLFANVFRRTWLLPGAGVGLLLVSAIVAGGILPAVVQWVQVRPSEIEREAPYLERNIAATRAAYDIDETEVVDYNPAVAPGPPPPGNVEQARGLPGVRLVDPYVVPPTFRQEQQIRPYYRFASALDVDRYPVNGRLTNVVIGVRELDTSLRPQQQRNWINDHLVYTHGFGVVAALADEPDATGSPIYVQKDIPPRGELDVGEYEPRIYFGEYSPEYSIVGAPPGQGPGTDREFDYPQANAERNTTYRGTGGVPIGSFLNRLMYAVKYQEEKILLAEGINSDSKILYIRSPRDRIQRVAPWLNLDGNPYPAIVNGRVLWIVDGYTTSASYPYSSHTLLDQATEDSLAARDVIAGQPAQRINYIRNSVKATVDAYDGTVSLYAWDEGDPVLKTWRSAFPGLVQDRAAMPLELVEHVRYPQDLFKVQRALLGNYHQTDPRQFYSGSDFWEAPEDPSLPPGLRGTADQPPYYLPIQMPGHTTPVYSLTTTFVPRGRENLTAFMSVGADPATDYGRMRVLRMPSNTQVPGPEQFIANWENNADVRQNLTPLRVGGAEARPGNVLTLPVGGTLFYVAPIYVYQTGAPNPYPKLQRVAVSFGEAIGFGNTFPDALNSLAVVRPNPGVVPGGGGAAPPPPPPPATPGATPAPGASPSVGRTVEQAIAEAQRAYQDSQTALSNGPDWEAYGQAQRRLREALEQVAAANAAARGRGDTATATSSASPSQSRSPGG